MRNSENICHIGLGTVRQFVLIIVLLTFWIAHHDVNRSTVCFAGRIIFLTGKKVTCDNFVNQVKTPFKIAEFVLPVEGSLSLVQ